MKNDDFYEFLTEGSKAPAELQNSTQKEIILSFQSASIIKRFLAFQLLGALISLSFCPQFGLSFFLEGHGFTHHLRMIGDWACAFFCGTLFLGSGALLALFFMKAEELWWLWKRRQLALITLPALSWGVLMLFNVSLKLPQESVSYHFSWLAAGIVVQLILLRVFENLKVDKF